MCFLTLPALPGDIAVLSNGKAATLLHNVGWLRSCRLIYWGDMDDIGFNILSRIRKLRACSWMHTPGRRTVHLPTLETWIFIRPNGFSSHRTKKLLGGWFVKEAISSNRNKFRLRSWMQSCASGADS